MIRVCAGIPDAHLRVDVWLGRAVPELSRSRLQALIRDGLVLVDGVPCQPSRRVSPGAVAEITVPETAPSDVLPEAIPLDVLYEDGDIIVVNKQPGLVVHPAVGHAGGTLVNALLYHCSDLRGVGGELRPGIVHRLDRDTSGAIVAAKHDEALASLMAQFKERTVRKEYLALVRGVPRQASGCVDDPIGRSTHDRKRMSTTTRHGREAVTHYQVEEVFVGVTLLRLRIETGRTHQIRVHLAHIGYPVLGDTQYGRGSAGLTLPCPVDRQMLHAERLTLRQPSTGRKLTFVAPPAPDMQRLLDGLRQYPTRNT